MGCARAALAPRREATGLDHVDDLAWLAPGGGGLVLVLGTLVAIGYGLSRLLGL